MEPAVLRLVAQHSGAEHRDKGKRGGRGDDHDDADNPAELLEHDSGHSGDHGERQEHAKHRQRGSDYGDTDFGGSVNGGLGRFLASLQVRGNVLQHHNGIVHHHTDRNGQGRHRYDVQCVACRVKVDQRPEQCNRDGQHDDERRPPAAKEYVDHEHDHQKGDDNRLLQGVKGVQDVRGAIDHGGDFHIRRKCGLNRLEFLLDTLDDVDGVGSGLFLDSYHSGSLTVGERLLRFFLKTVDDCGHIPEINSLAVPRADHNVQQLGRILEFLLDTKRE